MRLNYNLKLTCEHINLDYRFVIGTKNLNINNI